MFRIPVLLVYSMMRLTHVELVHVLLVTSVLENFFIISLESADTLT